MDEQNQERPTEHAADEEHPGCKCGGVCRITGDCGKHLLGGDREEETPAGAEKEV